MAQVIATCAPEPAVNISTKVASIVIGVSLASEASALVRCKKEVATTERASAAPAASSAKMELWCRAVVAKTPARTAR